MILKSLHVQLTRMNLLLQEHLHIYFANVYACSARIMHGHLAHYYTDDDEVKRLLSETRPLRSSK